MKDTKIRYSKQRELILSNLQNRCDHPTAEMIYQDLKQDHPNLSLGTVYRNLNQLCQSNQILRLDMGGPMVRYDGNVKPHIHFVCEHCGKIYDIESIDTTLIRQLQEQQPHKINSIDIKLTGICQECLHQQKAA